MFCGRDFQSKICVFYYPICYLACFLIQKMKNHDFQKIKNRDFFFVYFYTFLNHYKNFFLTFVPNLSVII